MKVLVTGSAGFIGFHFCKILVENGINVIGLDIINDYYDINLKYDRLRELGINDFESSNKLIISEKYNNFSFIKSDIADYKPLEQVFKNNNFDYVVNLAAQAGVRYSLINPFAYTKSNIDGFLNILELCKTYKIKHLIYASSSSVYGLNKKMPLSTKDSCEHPISLYAATKKSNEMLAHSYSYLFDLPTTGLRFFTVYGPWGRPDMALFLFAKAIMNNKPIDVYNHGDMIRDFTYVDDIVKSIFLLLKKDPPKGNKEWDNLNPDPSSSSSPYKIYNIGNSSPVLLNDYILQIEKSLSKKAIRNNMPIQPGDVTKTHSDVKELYDYINFKPETTIAKGINAFVLWYKKHYKSE